MHLLLFRILAFVTSVGIANAYYISSYSFKSEKPGDTFNYIRTLPDSAFNYKSFEKQNTPSPYWIRLKYYNPDPGTLFYIDNPFIFQRSLALYYQINDSTYYQKADINQFFDKNAYKSHWHVLQLPNYSDTIVLHARVEPSYNFFQEFLIFESRAVFEQFNRMYLEFYSLGISSLALIFSLLLFGYLKDRIYAYYALFSLALIGSRLVHNGYIFNYLHLIFEIQNLHQILCLYAITYASLTVSTLLYFRSFLNISATSHPKLNALILTIVAIRTLGMLLYVFAEPFSIINLGNGWYLDLNDQLIDLVCLIALIPISILKIYTETENKNVSLLAFMGTLIVITGNYINYSKTSVFIFDGYTAYLHISSFEVLFFLSALGYRHYHLKKELEKSLLKVIDQMKETEQLKDKVNRELEQKVEERTEEIRKMNELLKLNNIELKDLVQDTKKALLFQENMTYEEFKNIFADDRACAQYLSDTKWIKNKIHKCKKCGYTEYKITEELSHRCRSCNYIESVTNHTLYHNVKFSLHKAFYITYITIAGGKNATIEELSNQIELRAGTYWKFQKRVQEVMENYRKAKKRKTEKWTQLIEYSIAHHKDYAN